MQVGAEINFLGIAEHFESALHRGTQRALTQAEGKTAFTVALGSARKGPGIRALRPATPGLEVPA